MQIVRYTYCNLIKDSVYHVLSSSRDSDKASYNSITKSMSQRVKKNK